MNLNTAIQEKDPEFIEEDISRRLYIFIFRLAPEE